MKLIFIAGPSGSGKTTTSKLLIKELKNFYIISTDNYYKTGFISLVFSKIIRSYFDKLVSLNIRSLKKDIMYILINKKINHTYKYDFRKKSRTKSNKKTLKIDYLIIEGIFSKEILNLIPSDNCFLINLNIKKHKCLERILKRDKEERGKNNRSSLRDFNAGWYIYKKKLYQNFKKDKCHEIVFNETPKINLILQAITKEDS